MFPGVGLHIGCVCGLDLDISVCLYNYDMSGNVKGIYNIMYMYVNKRVDLAQRGIALEKMYVLLLLLSQLLERRTRD